MTDASPDQADLARLDDGLRRCLIDPPWRADREELSCRMAAAWSDHTSWVPSRRVLEHVSGPDTVIEVFRAYLADRVDQRVGTLCTLANEEVSP